MMLARPSVHWNACTAETCLKRTGGACPFHRARMAAQSAHLLIVNHALLLSDIATGNKVLPEYSRLIIDEGHHVESATTSALSFRLTQYELERYLKDLGGPSAGVLGRVLTETEGVLRPSDLGLLQQRVDRATDMAFRLEQLNREFFDTLAAFVDPAWKNYQNLSSEDRRMPDFIAFTRSISSWTRAGLVRAEVGAGRRVGDGHLEEGDRLADRAELAVGVDAGEAAGDVRTNCLPEVELPTVVVKV